MGCRSQDICLLFYSDLKDRNDMHLSDLPNELLIHLINYLDWPSLKCVRLTSRSFSELIPKGSLAKIHTHRSHVLHEQELLLLQEKTELYWEEAEESFLGYHSSSYTSSSLDPDLRAELDKLNCVHHELPCYHCLSWKCSMTDDPQFEKFSAFSRRMITASRNLGSKNSSTRICIDCGIRSGLYTKGVMLKHSARCRVCGDFTEPMTRNAQRPDRMEKVGWQPKWLCMSCCTDSKYSKLTLEQFRHELRWEKYEAAMTASKAYRLEKGKELRDKEVPNGILSNGIRTRENHRQYEKPRFCPVMHERRLCHCSSENS